MDYQVTVRYGRKKQRYFSMTLSAPDVSAALRQTAEGLPPEVIPEADLVELREAPDFDKTFDASDP